MEQDDRGESAMSAEDWVAALEEAAANTASDPDVEGDWLQQLAEVARSATANLESVRQETKRIQGMQHQLQRGVESREQLDRHWWESVEALGRVQKEIAAEARTFGNDELQKVLALRADYRRKLEELETLDADQMKKRHPTWGSVYWLIGAIGSILFAAASAGLTYINLRLDVARDDVSAARIEIGAVQSEIRRLNTDLAEFERRCRDHTDQLRDHVHEELRREHEIIDVIRRGS